MILGQKGVKYGLQVRKPEKAAKPAPAKKNVFGEDASDDEEDNVERQIARHAARKQGDKKVRSLISCYTIYTVCIINGFTLKPANFVSIYFSLQVAEMHEAALAEDSSVFDYDSHYDSIQAQRSEPKRQEKMARESRYIASLLEKAEERKREQSVLYERQLAKERVAEDHLYGDKERFITAAYKKKLEEDAQWKDEQKRQQDLEERNAVEKRGHMGDFYRNILRNNVAFGTAAAPSGPPTTDAAAPGGEKEDLKFESRAIPRDVADDDIMPERRAQLAREAAQGVVAGSERPGGGPRGEEAPIERIKDGKDRDDVGGPVPVEGKVSQREKIMVDSESGRDRKVTGDIGDKEKKPVEPAAASGPASVHPKRDDAIAAARERYLARKRKAGALE